MDARERFSLFNRFFLKFLSASRLKGKYLASYSQGIALWWYSLSLAGERRDPLSFNLKRRPLRMKAKDIMTSPHQNILLDALSPDSRELLLSRSTPIRLPLRTMLYEAQETPPFAYFPTSGLASVVTLMSDGGSAEVGLVGREGVVGALHLLGPGRVPTQCFMQIDGAGLRISLAELRSAMQARTDIRDLVLESAQEQSLSISQVAGCNRLHNAEERLARWLLMAQDRTQTDVLTLTQEFMAEMLGTRRTTVTMVAGALQKSGLIEYKRGQIKIVSRENLEAAACDCYQITKQLYLNLYKKNEPASQE
jgi:CRP-like cAMP-binding protein